MWGILQSVVLAVLAIVVAADHVPTTTVTATPPAITYVSREDVCTAVHNLHIRFYSPNTGLQATIEWHDPRTGQAITASCDDLFTP